MSREEGINKPQLIREKFTISVPTIFEENDEKFVLRLVFVLRQTLTLLLAIFDGNFFIIRKVLLAWAQDKMIIFCDYVLKI